MQTSNTQDIPFTNDSEADAALREGEFISACNVVRERFYEFAIGEMGDLVQNLESGPDDSYEEWQDELEAAYDAWNGLLKLRAIQRKRRAAHQAYAAEVEHQADKARADRHWDLSDTLGLKAAFKLA